MYARIDYMYIENIDIRAEKSEIYKTNPRKELFVVFIKR